MAYADFSRTLSETKNTPSLGLDGGADGTAQLNSGLSNPLTTTGIYCRKYAFVFTEQQTTPTPSMYAESKNLITTPALVDLTHDQAISIRARMRVAFHSSWGSDTDVLAIGAYIPQSPGGSQSNNAAYGGGWCLELQRHTTNQMRLSITTNSGLVAANGVPNIRTNATTPAENQWLHLRLDVLPTTLTSADLKAFQSVDDGANWTQIASTTVNSSQPTFWRNDGYIGYFARTYHAEYGTDVATNFNAYIDDFQVFVDPVT